MGIIGRSFGRLFSTIWDGIKWLGENIAKFFSWLGQLIWDAIKWLGNLLKDLFYALMDLLLAFFQVIYDLISAFLYLIYQIGLIAVKLFLIFFEVAKLIVSFFVGLARTLASLFYTPRTSSGTGYSETIGKLFTYLEPVLQLNVIAYILLFGIWLFTAIQAIKLLSGMRVGGD
ncbi:MAG TPA: hypothetical protein GX525_12060 [Bacilli bacterium]|nr:hypothetical protein [Bacilli bacterium]